DLWRHRRSDRSDTLLPEIAGIDDEMITEFSPRSAQVRANLARLVGEYKERHGYSPDRATTARLAQEAVMEGRPRSQQRSWADEQSGWLDRAGRLLEVDSDRVGATVRARIATAAKDQDKDDRLAVDDLVPAVLRLLEETGATWSERDVQRHSTAALREHGFVDTDLAEQLAVQVMNDRDSVPIRAADPGGETPALLQRRSGRSVFERAGEARYTSVRVLESETRLAALADASGRHDYADLTDDQLERRMVDVIKALRDRRPTGSEDLHGADRAVLEARRAELTETAAGLTVERARRRNRPYGRISPKLEGLSDDQAAAVGRLADGSRPVDTLVGPAGSGKSTALGRLTRAWREQGRGVVVLAPTAMAAGVIGEAVGEAGDTLDAALNRWERGDDLPVPGSLVLIDEASMATSPKLTQVIETALVNGAIVRCVGDPRQLKAVGAGGGLSILADAVDGPVLTNMHRFEEAWEGPASLRIRQGDPGAIAEYERAGRVTAGLEPDAVETVYQSWKHSPYGPNGTLMIASDNETVRTLGERARADRVAAGEVEAGGLELRDGSVCGVGDVIVTRRNDRTIPVGHNPGAGGYVRNRDRWIVTGRNDDGELAVRHTKTHAEAILPSGYVAEHVELSYAVTGHGAQGLTVDAAHALIQSTDARQYTYVAMTRGRVLNQVHVVTGQIVDEPAGYEPEMTARSVLAQVLANDEPVSARDHVRVVIEKANDLFEMVSRYRHVQTEEMLARVRPVLEASGAGDLLDQPDGWRLRQALEMAEDRGFNSAELLALDAPVGVEEYAVEVQRACWSGTSPGGARVQPHPMFAGLVAAPGTHVDAEVAAYLERLGEAITERRAGFEHQIGLGEIPVWAAGLGPPPGDQVRRSQWVKDVAQVAVWRQAQGIIDGEDVLGPALPPGHRDARGRAAAAAAISRITEASTPSTRLGEDENLRQRRHGPDSRASMRPQ
ncbi:MAG: AAA family ATPase, partial [Actinomycetota bacterium]|nr:AAA family ATPase [Actinomycetota bacterium]